LAELQQELNNAEAELTNIKRQHAQLEPELQKRRDDLKQIRLSVREMQLEIEVFCFSLIALVSLDDWLAVNCSVFLFLNIFL